MSKHYFKREPQNPNFFWVNIDETHLVGREGKYAHQPYGLIWVPEIGQQQGVYLPLAITELVLPGDIIFFYDQGQIRYVGRALNRCYSSQVTPTLVEKGSRYGWRVDVDYAYKLEEPFEPKAHIDALVPKLTKHYSPIDAEGNATEVYVSHLSTELGELLLKLCRVDLTTADANEGPITSELRQWSEHPCFIDTIADLEQVQENRELDSQTKRLLINARLGRGKFEKEVATHYHECPVTGISLGYAVSVCHIKPWRACSIEEQMNPANGILLANHIRGLFEGGMISFDSNGLMQISSYVKDQLRAFQLTFPLKITIPAESIPFIEWHLTHHFLR